MSETSRKSKESDIVFGTHCEYVDGDRKVQFEWIGEGISGDYNPEDPDDAPQLRFAVFDRTLPGADAEIGEGDGWTYVEDTSYCCGLDAALSTETKLMAARFIMAAVKDQTHLKRICEGMSWIKLRDVVEFGERAAAAESVSPGM